MKVLQAVAKSNPGDAGVQLANVACPVLVVEGSTDPDWADPRAEGERIIADLPEGRGELAVIKAAGPTRTPKPPTRSSRWPCLSWPRRSLVPRSRSSTSLRSLPSPGDVVYGFGWRSFTAREITPAIPCFNSVGQRSLSWRPR